MVSGPSGAGKTTLCAEVIRDLPWLEASVSHTTRAPRPGEENGRQYHFVDRGTFEEMIRVGQFLEWAEVHGHLYGSSWKSLEGRSGGRDLLFEVDCIGAKQIQKKIEGAVLIFIMTPSLEDLVRRIQRRGAVSGAELAMRLQTARREIRQVAEFDFLVINDRFTDAVDALRSILISERCRLDLRAGHWIEKWAREFDRLSELPS
ncbi:MAG: guanylate kinase [bacterium]